MEREGICRTLTTRYHDQYFKQPKGDTVMKQAWKYAVKNIGNNKSNK